MLDLVVCIPTFNEAENIGQLLNEIQLLYAEPTIIVVDDGSKDGTIEIVEDLASKTSKIILLKRSQKEGLGQAYAAGFALALQHGAGFICQMDGDRSHPPQFLKDLYDSAKDADLVIGSRYTRGGCCYGWAWHRHLLSRCGNIYARLFVSSAIHDLTGGFNMWRREALSSIDWNTINSRGYAFQVELKAKTLAAGLRVCEIPITFFERHGSKSKMTFKIAIEALLRIPTMSKRFRNLKPSRKRRSQIECRLPSIPTPN